MAVAGAERSTTEIWGQTGPYRVIGSPHDGGSWYLDLQQGWSRVVELVCLPHRESPTIRCFLSASASPQRVLELTERLVQEAVDRELPVTWGEGGSVITAVAGSHEASRTPLKRPLEINELDGMDKLLWINTPYGVVRRISRDTLYKNRGIGTAQVTADFPLSTVSAMERFVKDLTGEEREGLDGIEELFFKFRVGYALTHGHILAEKMAKEILEKDHRHLPDDQCGDLLDKLAQLLMVAESLRRGVDPKLYAHTRSMTSHDIEDLKREAGDGDIIFPTHQIGRDGKIREVSEWTNVWKPMQPKA